MKKFSCLPCVALAALSSLLAGCQTDDHVSATTSHHYYYGHYDPWYYGDCHDDNDVIVVPPPDNRPDNGLRPAHPIARPPQVSPSPRPSIPSTPRPSFRGGGGGGGRRR